MGDATFTPFHEQIIMETRGEVDGLKKLVGEIHAVVTNGLRDNVKQLRDDAKETREKIEILADPKLRAKSCPLIRARGERRKSWDWMLTILVAVSSILLNIGTFYVLMRTGVL